MIVRNVNFSFERNLILFYFVNQKSREKKIDCELIEFIVMESWLTSLHKLNMEILI